MEYLTQAWLDECRRLWSEMPAREGASARVQYVVAGDPEVRYSVVYLDGHIASAELGDLPDPEVTLTSSAADSLAVARGELDPNAAYADGKIGFSGDMRTLMGMFPVIWPSATGRLGAAARYRALQERIREMTEFP